MSKIFTSSDLQAYMQSPANWNDAVGAQVTDSLNQWIDTYTHRCFGEIKTVTERYDWSPSIWLRHMDIKVPDNNPASTVPMTIKLGYPHLQQSTLDSTSFFYNKWGRVTMYLQAPFEFNPSAVNNDLVEITYSYGYVDPTLGTNGYLEDGETPVVPDDLVMATLGIAAGFYNWATSNQRDIVAASIGTYRLQYLGAVRGAGSEPGVRDSDFAINHDKQNWSVLDSYKMKRA